MSSIFRIIHFNDVYETDLAPRFQTVVNQLRSEVANSILLFSGDVLSPSTLSVITKGLHMADVFAALKVDAACIGNHDLDFGEGLLAKFVGKTKTCRWLSSNLLSLNNQPLANCLSSTVLTCGDCRIGIIGVMEEEAVATVPAMPPHKYVDFKKCAMDLAALLRPTVDIVVALAHCRVANSLELALVPGVDLVLGGHEHVVFLQQLIGVAPTMVSGSDFRFVQL
jgi:5'-nucleotidase